jgi:hypothetical protein
MGRLGVSVQALKEFEKKYTENEHVLDNNHYHHHHLALQPFVGFHLLSQVSPSFSVLSCFLPVFYFQLF